MRMEMRKSRKSRTIEKLRCRKIVMNTRNKYKVLKLNKKRSIGPKNLVAGGKEL